MRLTSLLLLSTLTIATSVWAAPVSKVWPMSDEGAAWMIENLPNSENLGYPVGNKIPAKLPDGYYAVVEAPAYIELLSNTFAYSAAMAAPKVEAVTRAGRPYKRYTFAPLQHRNYSRWASFFTLWVPHPTDADRQAPGVFAWHYVTPQGAEPEQSLPIKLLPELPAFTAPKRLQVRLWQGSVTNCQPDKLHQVLTLLQRSGFNTVPWWESKRESLLQAGVHQMGLKIGADQSGHAGWPQMAKPSPKPEYQNRDNQGHDLAAQDPQWIIDNNGAPWKNDLAYCRHEASQVDVLSEDIEYNTGTFNTGFSPAGIRAFAKRNHLVAQRDHLGAAHLTPQIIWSRYRKQWYDFRAWQTLKLVQLYYHAAKAGNPKVDFEFLPGSPYTTTDPNTLSQMVPLAKDPLGRMVYLTFPFPLNRMSEAMDDVMPMWYGHGASQVWDNFTWSRALTSHLKTPLIVCLQGQGREFYYPGGDAGPVLRAMDAAAVLGGARGLCYWLGEFSPLQLSWLARGYRELAQVENVIFDGRPDPAGITITPMPQRHFTLVSGKQRRTYPEPDFAKSALWRAYAEGSTRLVGVINLNAGLPVYFKLSVRGLPAGRYHVYDVAQECLLCPDPGQDAVSDQQLRRGLVLRTPANYGISLVVVAPAGHKSPAGLSRQLLSDLVNDYADYRRPDTTGAVLAQRAGLTIRYDMVGRDNAKAILIESPEQQVWVRPEAGGRISDWKIKAGNRTVVTWTPPYGGAAADLFWSPANAHWGGDETRPYQLVYAKIHGGKAYLRLRQKKQAPSLQGLVVTKTIIVPADRTDVEVNVQIENPGPAPEVGIAPWVHNEFNFGQAELAKSQPRLYPRIFAQTAQGPTEAALGDVVWAKPGQGYLPGNENWEKKARNGVTTGDWIAQRNPVTGEAVLCQIESPPVAQFYSWRDPVDRDNLSVEWMYPYLKLAAGRQWQTTYLLRYLESVAPANLEKKLLPPLPAPTGNKQ